MRKSLAIRIVAYAVIVAGLVFLWSHRQRSSAIPVGLASATDSYFSFDSQGPVELEPEVVARAGEITEIVFHTSMPQTGIEPLRLRLRRDGVVVRNTVTLSDYKLYPNGVSHAPILKMEKISEGHTADFERLAYLLSALRYRSLPLDPGFAPISGESIDVLRKNGKATTFYFLDQPPEFWAIVQSFYLLEKRVSWEVKETKTCPTNR